MKKNLSLILALTLVFLLTSCASVPKKIKPGDSLVIGQAKIQSRGYKDTGYGNMNGTFKGGIEITIKDLNTNKEKVIKTDKDGYFFVKGLAPHNPHQISKVKMTVSGNNGTYSTWVEFTNAEIFIPYDNLVTNIGCTTYIFDGKTNTVWFECRDHYKMRSVFKERSEGTEWQDKKIYDQCGLR